MKITIECSETELSRIAGSVQCGTNENSSTMSQSTEIPVTEELKKWLSEGISYISTPAECTERNKMTKRCIDLIRSLSDDHS